MPLANPHCRGPGFHLMPLQTFFFPLAAIFLSSAITAVNSSALRSFLDLMPSIAHDGMELCSLV
jgi:hypothetical protein